MPNQIVNNLLSCFGLDCLVNTPSTNPTSRAQRPATATPVAPASTPQALVAQRAVFVPGRIYSIAELNQFATVNLPCAIHRPQFLQTLLQTILQPETTRPNKAMLCKHLANLMTDEDTLMCHGAPRQANYFASYCSDLMLQELEHQYSAAMEQDLRDVLHRWVNTLCPGQTNFNINGVIYTREEVQNMLQAPSLISRQILQGDQSSLAVQLDRRLHGQGRTTNYQTVHDPAVQNNGRRVLDIMRTKHLGISPISDDRVIQFITEVSNKHPSNTAILAGMNQCLQREGRDSNWNENLSANRAIKDVVQYIESKHSDPMYDHLTNALLNRLIEIHMEGPCISGILQRLLDVPNGIDPDMNFAGQSHQIGEEMATLAGKTYEQFNDLIDEGVRAIEDLQGDEKVAKEVTSQIGRSMFHTRVNQDMKLRGGIPEAELEPHRERLQAGFD